MKSFYFSLILLLTISPHSSICSPEGGGELLVRIINSVSGRINISFTANNYVWDWIAASSTVTPLNGDYQEFFEMGAVSFTAPKNGSAALKIYWGYYQVSVQSLKNDGSVDFARTFYLDLRDEGWSITGEGGYQGVDTFIRIDQTEKEVYLEADHNGYFNSVLIFGEESINRIWELWNSSPPDQNNFKIPVTLKNRIEGGPSTDFGSLWANSHQVSSGTQENFSPYTTNNVQHYTIETIYQNERKYSFKWIPAQIQLNGNVYNSNTDFTIFVTSSPKDITRNFRTVWPLKLKNVSIESNSTESFGSIYFKDPTTDNQFHLYSASGENGFEKNEAFEGLNENIPGYGYSKYSVKAVSTIPYNGRNYYWYSGDFNPTTQTDFLITGTTTKTAYYKGNLCSSDQNAISSASQRKMVRTDNGQYHIVYESMGTVWYAHSATSDFYGAWNPEQQILDHGKNPAIDYDENLVTIVFEEYDPQVGGDARIHLYGFSPLGNGV